MFQLPPPRLWSHLLVGEETVTQLQLHLRSASNESVSNGEQINTHLKQVFKIAKVALCHQLLHERNDRNRTAEGES